MPASTSEAQTRPAAALREALLWPALITGASAPSRQSPANASFSHWRPLYGGFYDPGVSIEWHDFQSSSRVEWSRSFHPDSLELCLNLSGHATVECGNAKIHFEPGVAGFYINGAEPLRAWREPGECHQFLTLEFAPKFLKNRLSVSDGALHRTVEHFLAAKDLSSCLAETRRLTSGQEQWLAHVMNPRVPQAARSLWFESKVLELIAEFFFARAADDELFCDRQKRVARERADRVVALLQRSLENPPTLEQIGREVGCSPFHLSRTFSQQMGMTIPQFLRKLRIEKAAELLSTGKCNVTEAAMAVGYSSLSHFSQAFCQIKGCCPGLYPLKANNR